MPQNVPKFTDWQANLCSKKQIFGIHRQICTNRLKFCTKKHSKTDSNRNDSSLFFALKDKTLFFQIELLPLGRIVGHVPDSNPAHSLRLEKFSHYYNSKFFLRLILRGPKNKNCFNSLRDFSSQGLFAMQKIFEWVGARAEARTAHTHTVGTERTVVIRAIKKKFVDYYLVFVLSFLIFWSMFGQLFFWLFWPVFDLFLACFCAI